MLYSDKADVRAEVTPGWSFPVTFTMSRLEFVMVYQELSSAWLNVKNPWQAIYKLSRFYFVCSVLLLISTLFKFCEHFMSSISITIAYYGKKGLGLR